MLEELYRGFRQMNADGADPLSVRKNLAQTLNKANVTTDRADENPSKPYLRRDQS
jgi:hypothetical protein